MPEVPREDRYDLVIRDTVERCFPELLHDLGDLAHLRVKAQVYQESRMDPNAHSSVGAAGLMQLMPATDRAIDGDLDGTDVVGNIDNGVRYLADQYRHLGEIPTHVERWRFALASYNGGRGYCNAAFELARQSEGLKRAFEDWVRAGRLPGLWQTWHYASRFLADPGCIVSGRHPDHRQMRDYVARIEERYQHYLAGACRVSS